LNGAASGEGQGSIPLGMGEMMHGSPVEEDPSDSLEKELAQQPMAGAYWWRIISVFDFFLSENELGHFKKASGGNSARIVGHRTERAMYGFREMKVLNLGLTLRPKRQI
jgi:hypothetical protein